MDLDKNLRTLRKTSLVVTVLSFVVIIAGLVQLGLGGIAVKQEYERIAEVEAMIGQPSNYYGYQRQYRELQARYNRSSSAFFLEGRFLPSDESLEPDAPGVITFGVLLASTLAFLVAAMMWVWRAHANLRDVGIRAKYGPGRAVSSYLIPLANLMLPFEAMRELYNRSEGEGDDFAHSTVENVTAWWTSVIVGLLILSAMIVKFALDAATNLIIMTPIWMEFVILSFAIILLLGSAYLFANLTRKITQAQMEILPQIEPQVIKEEAPSRPTVNIIG